MGSNTTIDTPQAFPSAAQLITMRLTGYSYNSVVLSPLGTTKTLPDFAYSITSEDGSGTTSN